MALPAGVYETLITKALARALEGLPKALATVAALDASDSHRVLARHVAGLVEQGLRDLDAEDDDRVRAQVEVCNEVIARLRQRLPRLARDVEIAGAARQLYAIVAPDPTGQPGGPWPRPATPLATNALLVNGGHEPNVGAELGREIDSADSIDLLCAFIKWHGLRVLLEPLRRFRERGGLLRVITTTYMGVTEVRALEELRRLGAELRVTYETDATRLHAKAWLFTRRSGFTTAYIGSSNLSKSALIDGLEWNVRVSAHESPGVIARFRAAFETYWESFPPLDTNVFRAELARQRARSGPALDLSVIDVAPHEYQRAMLYQLEVERRELGRTRNLIVAATGTGKTLIAAFDFARLRKERPEARLLFVAHRKEILEQSRSKFRAVLRDNAFGELFVDGHRPEEWRNVFASIQSLGGVEPPIDPRRFDVVVVDEFHHAHADSYRKVLGRLEPWQLLGLTATPERGDGANVADEFFDGRIAAELRLWDALEQNLLSPFHYFGIGSDVDLSGLTFRRSSGGYAVGELERVYTSDDARVREVLVAVDRHLSDRATMRGLGFCVSREHARFMAQRFTAAGIASEAVLGDSSAGDRASALSRLNAGTLRMVFTVDLFNEGVDLPDVDTLLFLRPTESPTLFLQQLGRGLRKREGKVLTVLDFVGRQHAEFRYDRRYRALVGGSRQGLVRQVEEGFGFLPPGCHLEFDRVAREHLLANLRRALSLRWETLVAELRSLGDVPLARWLAETGLELEEFYRGTTGKRGLARLRREAGVGEAAGPSEETLARAVSRCLHVNDRELLGVWLEALAGRAPPELEAAAPRLRTQLSMLSALLWDRQRFNSLAEALGLLWAHPALRRELTELLTELCGRIDHQALPLGLPLPVPLHTHCRYSLSEVLAAFGEHRADRPFRTQAGAHHVTEFGVDLFFVTLMKSEKDYSPTTMYRDFALTPWLFHWESQADQEPDDAGPQRYIARAQRDRGPLLFVREHRKDARGSTAAYTLLGSVQYVKHEGARPIAFTWKLRDPIPPDVFAAARAVSG